MRLTKSQRELLIAWIAEGLQTDEINRRSQAEKPPFAVTRSLVEHYRRTRAVDIQKLIAEQEHEALCTGLARRAVRVAKLANLANTVESSLLESAWLTDVKEVGGQLVYVEKPNAVMLAEYRAYLEQIAKETSSVDIEQRLARLEQLAESRRISR